MALLTSAAGFNEARAATAGTKYHARIDRAAINNEYVILLRWAEIRHFANVSDVPWPLAAEKKAAYFSWEAAVNATINSGLGRNGTLTSFSHSSVSHWREQVMNVSDQSWCEDGEHNNSKLSCDPNWVKDQPCCDSCGDHPWGVSNICMDETRRPPAFRPPVFELPPFTDEQELAEEAAPAVEDR